MLYQCEVGRVAPEDAIAAYGEIEQGSHLGSAEAEALASRLVIGTVERTPELDPLIAASSDRARRSSIR